MKKDMWNFFFPKSGCFFGKNFVELVWKSFSDRNNSLEPPVFSLFRFLHAKSGKLYIDLPKRRISFWMRFSNPNLIIALFIWMFLSIEDFSCMVLVVLHLCLLRYAPQHKSCWSFRHQLHVTQFFLSPLIYTSLFWNLEICSLSDPPTLSCVLLCSLLILPILLFFSTLLSVPCFVFSFCLFTLFSDLPYCFLLSFLFYFPITLFCLLLPFVLSWRCLVLYLQGSITIQSVYTTKRHYMKMTLSTTKKWHVKVYASSCIWLSQRKFKFADHARISSHPQSEAQIQKEGLVGHTQGFLNFRWYRKLG